MARVNKAAAPYYDDYDTSKRYTQLLAIPGRVAQAREITQIQSTVKDIVKSLGDSFLKDGNIIEGCQVIVNTQKTAVTVTEGKVYLNGMVLPVVSSTIAITGVGTELIGVKLSEIIITENEDNTLRDPAQGYDNFNQAGCHRIRSTVDVVLNDPDAATLATLIDGSPSVEHYAPDYDGMTQTLARRTYDESGSYIVNGLTVRIEAHPTDNTKFNVVVESGKAYVLGYELKIPVPRRITLPRATSYSRVAISERYLQTKDTYQLSPAPYIKEITLVQGEVSATVNQTISSNTDRVLLDELNVTEITSVSQGDTVYTVGTDGSTGDCYRQREGTRYYLKWNGTANYPALNANYSVTYSYTKTFEQGTDYELFHDITDDSHNLKWITAGTQPISNTNFIVDYDQYLARKDTIYIDKDGVIAAIQGNPAEYRFEISPDAPVNTLSIASIMSPPSGEVSENPNLKIVASNIGLTRFTMNDIQKLLNRIRILEYDQTILSLNEVAKQYSTPQNKKGIFTDPLIDLSKVDYYYNLLEGEPIDDTKPVYDVTLDLLYNLCYLPTVVETRDAAYDSVASNSNTYGRLATLAKTGESVVLSQNSATKSFLINPYSIFPQLPEISLSPAVDVWIDNTIITVPVSINSSSVIKTSTRNLQNEVFVNNSAELGVRDTNVTSVDTSIGVRVDTNSQDSILTEKAITYIRPRTITVEGSQFPPAMDNIKCSFDGIEVPLSPTGTTTAGTTTGTIRSDSNGKFTATFNIPENVLTGIREVLVEYPTIVEGYEKSASALYQASGTARTIQRTVTTLTTVLLNRVITSTQTVGVWAPIDPVGQTFVLNRMTLLSGIDLYFAEKPVGNTPVSCEIREVVNGTITSTVYGHKTLSSSEVTLSSDSRVATRFNFDDPVLLEENKEYAFVVRSTSASYKIWVAELGENDIITGNPVLSNPYLIGVMMSSSNNSSWTNHQTTDIKFKLIADTYSATSDILFNQITSTEDFCRLYLLGESVIPSGTSVDWYYSTDSGVTYNTISPYNIKIFDQLKHDVIVKATLKREENNNLSPIVALDSVGVTLSHYDTLGYYITRTIPRLDQYSTVDIILDTHLESGTSIEVYVLDDVDDVIGNPTKASLVSTAALNYGWNEQVYRLSDITPTAVVGTSPAEYRCKIFVKLSSNYQYFTPSFQRVRVIIS